MTSNPSDIAVEPGDITDGLGISRKMSDVVESLDTRELDMGDGEETDNDPTTIGDSRIGFSAVYHTVGFKESEARVYLPTVPITAKILEVERFNTAQDRFNITAQRSVNKSQPALFKIELRHGEFSWVVKRKEKHFMDLHRELVRYKMFMRVPLPSRRYTHTQTHTHIQWLAKVFTPLGIFPILLPYNLELKWIFWGFVSFDLHNMPTTLKMQNIFFCETNKK
uniref:PX domain-containing protein n=1 Tax=Hucho hucho TaxID=62062 RepID=A0A4W5KU32_9TELE